MAKVKEFSSLYGISVDIDGTWHKFQSGITIEVEPGDQGDLESIKQKAHNTVQQEVEKQLTTTLQELNKA